MAVVWLEPPSSYGSHSVDQDNFGVLKQDHIHSPLFVPPVLQGTRYTGMFEYPFELCVISSRSRRYWLKETRIGGRGPTIRPIEPGKPTSRSSGVLTVPFFALTSC